MIEDDDDTDDKMAVNDYLVQNIKQEEVIESLEVYAIKRGNIELER